MHWPRPTLWEWIFILLMLGGLYALWLRVTAGLGAATHLTDQFPWGLFTGLNVFCGLSLSVGGFLVAFIVELFKLRAYRPILRASILTAFIGYLLAMGAFWVHLGRPASRWRLMMIWNPHSAVFGEFWCALLYTAVLVLVFAPAVARRLGWAGAPAWVSLASLPLLLLAVILSLFHQHSLAELFVLMGTKLSPLWSTPFLPLFLLLSALCASLALLLFTSWQVGRAFGHSLAPSAQAGLGRALAVLLSVYLILRIFDLDWRGAWTLLLGIRLEATLLGLELALFLLPALLLWRPHVRADPASLFACSVLVIAGFVTNHLNVSITSLEVGLGIRYVPKWTEVTLAYSFIALGLVAFRFVAKKTPIFAEEASGTAPATMSTLAAW